ncbi:uncharacterized protein ARMOST_04494 [Armillaria ostoyae]|uniref:Uncharacterized protein n=1 Tax=Armillaria ostoyae TaxID=47428 RepID=A0A284QXH3_ARMOS|nr:uncharacterized protein ARMOST_04494 [Armillaria ostoyae]
MSQAELKLAGTLPETAPIPQMGDVLSQRQGVTSDSDPGSTDGASPHTHTPGNSGGRTLSPDNTLEKGEVVCPRIILTISVSRTEDDDDNDVGTLECDTVTK